MDNEQNVKVAMEVAEKAVAAGHWTNALALDFVEKAKRGEVDAQAWMDQPVLVKLAGIANRNLRR